MLRFPSALGGRQRVTRRQVVRAPTATSSLARVGLWLISEPVTHASHREEVLRLARVALELLAQVADMDVDRARVAVGGVAPDLLEQHLAGHHAARGAGERREDLELHVGQPDLRATSADGPALEVDLEVAGADRPVAARAATEHLDSAQGRLHAAAELADGER